jgi:exosortase/archaeosortase family protein
MLSLLALSALLGYFGLRSAIPRSVLFVSAVPVAMVVNILRILLLIVVFYYFRYDLTAPGIHPIFGISIYLCALLLIFAAERVLKRWDRSPVAE